MKPTYFATFLDLLIASGMVDYTPRPTEQQALFNLEMDRGASHDMALLSTLEYEVLQLERTFMRNFSDRTWRIRNGVEMVGQKYAWIASRHKGVGPLQARAILDDVSYVLKALAVQEDADALVRERFTPFAA